MPRSRREVTTGSLKHFYLGVFALTLLDQITKWVAVHFLSQGQSIWVLEPFFQLSLVYNKGIAFGMLREQGEVLTLLITVSLVVLFWWVHQLKDVTKLSRLALIFILGGALGNWIDRIRVGAVIDFFDFRVWPVFNVADSCITIGVILYFIYLIRPKTLS